MMNEHYRYVILGAGPAGLSLAHMLKRYGEDNFIIVEKEKEAGGLCRSEDVDGAPLDIGGGHFLDVRRIEVNRFLFEFMPQEEWNLFERDSRIEINKNEINHPLEANIWQFPIEEQVAYLKSIAVAGCNIGEAMPEEFIEWISWKLGSKIAEDYMIPYNSKIFGKDLNMLGTYWLDKLPNVSFEETLLSCLEKQAYGIQPGHAQFFYPKKTGYGEVWLRMAREIEKHIVYNKVVTGIDFHEHSVYMGNEKVKGEYIITTIPWDCMKRLDGISSEINTLITKLKHTSVYITYIPKHIDSKAQWIYYPSLELPYHRILLRENFCTNAKGYWTETNAIRYVENENIKYFNEYAYPLNTIEKPNIMEKVLTCARQYNVIGLGRWGEHQHYNSDVVVQRAMNLARELTGK